MRYPRWALAWALYWMGDSVSRVLNHLPDRDIPEWPSEMTYTVYNRLMLASIRVQGDGEGPWYPPESK